MDELRDGTGRLDGRVRTPGAHERLQAMVRDWEATGDRRAIFAESYGHMTGRMQAAISAEEFADNEWVAHLLDVFAGYYFVACDRHDAGDENCPRSWVAAFDACTDPGQHPLQALFLGVNAHINHDLVFALADVMEDWPDLDDAGRERRHVDHLLVNDVIGRTVDEVQDEVVDQWAPIMDHVDRLLGPLDEWVFSRMIAGWRNDVWDATQQLLAADDTQRPAVAAAVDARARRIATLVQRF